MKITDIDKNMLFSSRLDQPDLVWHDPAEEPFAVEGVFPPSEDEPYYHRMPHAVAKTVNEGVENLAKHTAGGRIRFMTDSPYVAIHVEVPSVGSYQNGSPCGTLGFDLLIDGPTGAQRYVNTFVPPNDKSLVYEVKRDMPYGGLHAATVNMPLYNKVTRVLIGLQRGSTLLPPPTYDNPLPVLFYGSSITQGGCASHPCCAYPAMLARELAFPHINLGFSGSARGEQTMANYIADIPMRIFVMDYDYNARNAEHLAQTHEPFYRTVRAKQPTLPVVFISAPTKHSTPSLDARREVILRTYHNALERGENVHFVDGSSFFSDELGEYVTVDNCHPNDLGFYAMARTLKPLLVRLLDETKGEAAYE